MANDFWETDGKRCLTCEFFDGYDVCCHKKNAGTVTNERIQNCPFNKEEFDKYINYGVERERKRLKSLNKRNLIIDLIANSISGIPHFDIRSLKIPVPGKDGPYIKCIFSECYAYRI